MSFPRPLTSVVNESAAYGLSAGIYRSLRYRFIVSATLHLSARLATGSRLHEFSPIVVKTVLHRIISVLALIT